MRRKYYKAVLTAVLAGSLVGKAVCLPSYGNPIEGEASVLSGGEEEKKEAAEGTDGEGAEGENPSPADTAFGEGGTPPPDAAPGGGESPPPDTAPGEGENPLPDAAPGGGETLPPDAAHEEGKTPPPDIDSGEEDPPPPPDVPSAEEETLPNSGTDSGEGEKEDETQTPDTEQPQESQEGELENPGDIQPSEILLQKIGVPLEEENKCDTMEELLELLAAGEEVCLTGDILVTGEEELGAAPEDEAVVNMNGYSIIVPDGSRLRVDGPIRFQGTVKDEALLQISGKTTLKNGVEVWAEGDGAIAVEISGTKRGKNVFETENVYIGVSGDNSTALKWMGKGTCSLEFAYIQAEGENSVGIDTDMPVDLRLCLVEAEGSSIVTDQAVIVDASQVTPFPEQSEVITREIYLDNRLDENGVSVEAGTDWQGLNDKLMPYESYAFYDSSGNRDMWTYVFDLNWEGLPEDLSEPGIYEAVISAEGYPDWFFMEIPDTEVKIYVVEPGMAHIEEIFRMEDLAVLRFLTPIEDAERIQLLCSADGGDTWQDAAAMSGCYVEISPLTITLHGLEMDHTYLFCASVTGGSMEGLSSVKPFGFYKNDSDRFGHGDRDGDDRDDQGELPPWDSAPPPGDGFGDTGDSNGGGTGEAFVDETETPDPSPVEMTEPLESPAPASGDISGVSADKDGENSRESARKVDGGIGWAGEDIYTEAGISVHGDWPRKESLMADTVTESREEDAQEKPGTDTRLPQRDNPAGFIFRTVLGAAAGIAVLSWYKRKSRRKP